MSNGHLSGQVRDAVLSRSELINIITPLRLGNLALFQVINYTENQHQHL